MKKKDDQQLECKVAVIGMGAMGTAITSRLTSCGHTVSVWNRTSERAQVIAKELNEKHALRSANPWGGPVSVREDASSAMGMVSEGGVVILIVRDIGRSSFLSTLIPH